MRHRHPITLSLDPLLDLLTCMLGVVMLVLLLTATEASQTTVAIPTPIQRYTTKRPVYIECRAGQLHLIPLDELRALASQATEAARKRAGTDNERFETLVRRAVVENEGYRVDLPAYVATAGGYLTVRPREDARGYLFTADREVELSGWFADLLLRTKPASEMVMFLVRDDNYPVFKRARRLSWEAGVDVAFDLFDANAALTFPLKETDVRKAVPR